MLVACVSGDESKSGRSFWALIGMQALNAFNDNVAKFALIPLVLALATLGQAPGGLDYYFGVLLVLPFILFAPLAGWLADRFAKNRVVVGSSVFQLVVLSGMLAALYFQSLIGVMVAFFALSLQSALLSPAKMGIVKELVGAKRLGWANGVMEGTVILAILLGQIVGGVWFDKGGLERGLGPWEAAMGPVGGILVGSILALGLTFLIRKTPPQAEKAPFEVKKMWGHFGDLKVLWQTRTMWWAAMGIAFFWGFGGFLQFLLIRLAEAETGGGTGTGVEVALSWLPVVVGIAVGSVYASWISRKHNELGLIVLGAILMAGSVLGFAIFLGNPVLLFLAGLGGATFLVPLNAFLQDRAPEDRRGAVLSASNLCNNVAGAGAVIGQGLFQKAGIPVGWQLVILGSLCLAVAVVVFRKLTMEFARLVGFGIIRSLYKVKSIGLEHVPEKGGVLLAVNHISFVDTLILSAACPRPIRFVMFADCFEKDGVGQAARFFRSIGVSRERAKEGIRAVGQSLKDGDVVCIFPEGQISRTGGLSKVQGGYRLMARQGGKAPVVPAFMSGLWGSVFTFAGGQFFGKIATRWRYRATVVFGEPVPDGDDLMLAMHNLSAVALEDLAKDCKSWWNGSPRFLGEVDEKLNWEQALERGQADDADGQALRFQAFRLTQAHVGFRQTRFVIETDFSTDVGVVTGMLWPMALKAKFLPIPTGLDDRTIISRVKEAITNIVVLNSSAGREDLVADLKKAGAEVWSLEKDPEKAAPGVFPLFVKDGEVVGYTLPDPVWKTETNLPQFGVRDGSPGRVLPGVQVEAIDQDGFYPPTDD